MAAIMHFIIVVVLVVAYKQWSFRCCFPHLSTLLRAQSHCTAYSPNLTIPHLILDCAPHPTTLALIWHCRSGFLSLSLPLSQLPMRPAAAAIKLILFCVCLSALFAVVRHCSPFDLRCKFSCVRVRFLVSAASIIVVVSNVVVAVAAAVCERCRALILFLVRRRRHFESEKN